MKAGAFLVITLASMGLATAASAVTVRYTLTCTSIAELCKSFFDNGTLSFSLPQTPTPDTFDFNKFGFFALPGAINGGLTTLTHLEILELPDPGIQFIYEGGPLGNTFVRLRGFIDFLGDTSRPALVSGNFSLSGPPITGNAGGRLNYQLSAIYEPGPSPEPSPVPVPHSWTMMLSGLAMLGAARHIARRRSLPGPRAA